MSEARTALDLAKKWEATSPAVCTRPGTDEENRRWGHCLAHIPADAPEQIERLTRDAKQADEQWQSAMSRIAHICQLLGVDFTCEESETCEQVIERLKEENLSLATRFIKLVGEHTELVKNMDEVYWHQKAGCMARQRDEEKAKREAAESNICFLNERLEKSMLERDDARILQKKAEDAQAAMVEALKLFRDNRYIVPLFGDRGLGITEQQSAEIDRAFENLTPGAARARRIVKAAESHEAYRRLGSAAYVSIEACDCGVCKAVRGEEKE